MPVYYIEQTEGPKASAARELIEARKSGDYKKMSNIYTAELGSVPEGAPALELETGNLCWWIFNAPKNIINNHSVTAAQVRKRAGYKCTIEGKRFAQVCAKIARERHGGTWRTVYEY